MGVGYGKASGEKIDVNPYAITTYGDGAAPAGVSPYIPTTYVNNIIMIKRLYTKG